MMKPSTGIINNVYTLYCFRFETVSLQSIVAAGMFEQIKLSEIPKFIPRLLNAHTQL